MYLGIDVHKRYAQVAVMDEAGEIVEEGRAENANLDDLAQRYAGAGSVQISWFHANAKELSQSSAVAGST